MKRSWESSIGNMGVAFGPGRLRELGQRLQVRGCRRVLLVSDAGVTAAGYANLAEISLRQSGVDVLIFDQVEENPSEANVALGAELAASASIDSIAAVGGGSVLDCAKGINFIVTNGGRMRDYQGYDKTHVPLLVAIGVPTTAGTGSEAQSFALISRDEDHEKMACGASDAAFREVLLDPELMATVPAGVAAASGLDAISHAVESYVSTRSNPISRLLSKEAWQLLDGSVERYLDDRGDAAAASDMLLGAHLAGAAIEKSMLGAAHACANPLTSSYGVTHGVAVALMLPAVVAANGAEIEADYARLLGISATSKPTPSQRLVARLHALNRQAGLGSGLGDYGVERHRLPDLAETAFEQWTARFNPRPLDVGQLLECYEASF